MNIPRLPGLQDRRNHLVNRLFGQYASQYAQQAGQQGQQGGGVQFNRNVNPAAMARTQMTQFDNVPINIRGLLGAGGQARALSGDASGRFGGEVQNTPATPLPTAPFIPLPGPGTGNPSAPTTPFQTATNFDTSGAAAPTASPLSSYQGGGPTASAGGVVPLNSITGGALTSLAGGGMPADAIPLGGGTYWSPTQGIIGGTSPTDTLSGATTRIGNSYQ